jgi:hypothetical protein
MLLFSVFHLSIACPFSLSPFLSSGSPLQSVSDHFPHFYSPISLSSSSFSLFLHSPILHESSCTSPAIGSPSRFSCSGTESHILSDVTFSSIDSNSGAIHYENVYSLTVENCRFHAIHITPVSEALVFVSGAMFNFTFNSFSECTVRHSFIHSEAISSTLVRDLTASNCSPALSSHVLFVKGSRDVSVTHTNLSDLGADSLIAIESPGDRFVVRDLIDVGNLCSSTLAVTAEDRAHEMARFEVRARDGTFLSLHGSGVYVVTRASLPPSVVPAMVSGSARVAFANCVLNAALLEDQPGADETAYVWTAGTETYLFYGGLILAGVLVGVGLFVALYCLVRALSRWNMRRRDLALR